MEGYTRRWNTELDCLAAKNVYPYGKSKDTESFHQVLMRAVKAQGLDTYAGRVVRAAGVAGRDRAAARRFIDAIKAMEATVDHVAAVELEMRAPEQGLDRFLAGEAQRGR